MPKEQSKSNVYCCVYNCNTRAKKRPDLSFHHFPTPGAQQVEIKNEFGETEFLDRRLVWERNLGRESEVTKSMRVCSLHFEDNAFIPCHKKARRVLKIIAFPTKNLPSESHSPAHRKQGGTKQGANNTTIKMLKLRNPTSCSIYGCSLSKRMNRKITFHMFPKKGTGNVLFGNEFIDRHNAWRIACKIDSPKRFSLVCSLHFLDTDFFPTAVHKKQRRQLKRNAVPSMYLPSAEISTKEIDGFQITDGSKRYVKTEGHIEPIEHVDAFIDNFGQEYVNSCRVPNPEMVSCWVEGCNHNGSQEECNFFKFPGDPAEFNRWCVLLRRKARPTIHNRVCSCHFKDGEKKNGPEILKVMRISRSYGKSPPLIPEVEAVTLPIFPKIEPGLDDQPYVQPSTSIKVESPTWAEVDPLHIKLENEDVYNPTISTQTDYPLERTSVAMLEAENYFLKQRVEELEKKATTQFSYDLLRNNDKLMRFYTGLSNVKTFENVYKLIENEKINYHLKWKVEKIDKRNQLLLCLMKLRHNFPTVDLVLRFGISRTTFSNIMISLITLLHEKIYKNSITTPEEDSSKIPSCMNTCKVILDCTEIATSVVFTDMMNKRTDWKSLVGIGPDGSVMFVSGLYPKSIPVESIVEECGILEQLKPNDLVLGDEAISGLLPVGVHLNFLPEEQDKYTERKAKAKAYIDLAVARMKKYKLLSSISHPMMTYGDKIVQLVSALTNYNVVTNGENEQFSDDE